ncbi:hypothetical protein, partial [Metallibacterium scheffleri]|uniref:hypothetical protein n=1 Tax=Metallibacterium scheffleri TaxID=993689 RepID=UPI0023F519C6
TSPEIREIAHDPFRFSSFVRYRRLFLACGIRGRPRPALTHDLSPGEAPMTLWLFLGAAVVVFAAYLLGALFNAEKL